MVISEVLLLIIAVSAAGMAAAVVRLVGPVLRATRELERLSRCASELRPRLDRLLIEAEGGLSDARQLAGRAEAIAADVQALTGSAKGLAVPLLVRLGALAAGAKAGMGMWHRLGGAGRHSPNGRGGV
jgi:hypothetical protein